MRFTLLFFLLLSTLFAADLEYYGLEKISDASISNKLRTRFKANGEPLFLLKDAHAGISIGDMIRFSDKAILIDANVMQSLSQDGALRVLSADKVVKLKAMGKSAVWKSRADAMKGTDRNGYRLGQELLKVLEENFGGVPKGDKIVLEFDGGYLAIVAPSSLLDKLKTVPVHKDEIKAIPKAQPEKPKVKGIPHFVSPIPQALRLSQSIDWQAWAIDSEHSSEDLLYAFEGHLPVGVQWDTQNHRLQGTPRDPGITLIHLTVRNSDGKEDTLEFNLEVQADSMPHIQDQEMPEALRGQKNWFVQLAAIDPDDKSSDLKWSLLSAPAGMKLDSTGKITWNIPDSIPTGPQSATIQIQDPWGAKSTRDFNINIVNAQERMRSANVELSLPKDTLIQYHCLTWLPHWISTSNATLIKVSGSQNDLQWSENTMRYCPSHIGSDSLAFEFNVEGKTLILKKTVWVLPNQAPKFLPSGIPTIEVGQSFSLRPSVYDPEGDSIQIQALLSDSSALQWDGKEIHFEASKPGIYGIEWIAKDQYGAESHQTINLQVLKSKLDVNRVTLENIRQSSESWWDLNYQRGSARIGLFSTNLDEQIYWQNTTDSLTGKTSSTIKDPADIYWPFLYVGASLLGSEAAAKGNHLFTDFGLTFRYLSNTMVGGGMMLRLSGEWTSPTQQDHSLFEWMLTIKQGVVLVVDTRTLEAHQAINQCLVQGDLNCVNQVIQKYQSLFPDCQSFDVNNQQCVDAITTFGLGKGLDRVLESTASTWNIVHSLRFEYERRIFDLPNGLGSLWFGPWAWRQDILLEPWFEEFLGGGSHWNGNYGMAHWSLGVGVGYGLAHREWTDAEKSDPNGLYYQANANPDLYLNKDWRYKTLEGMRILMDFKLSFGE